MASCCENEREEKTAWEANNVSFEADVNVASFYKI